MTREAEITAAVADEFGASIEYRRPAWVRGVGGRGQQGWRRGGTVSLAGALAELHALALDGQGFAALVPARTETRWFQAFAPSWEVRFLRGRVRFPGHTGGSLFPSAMLIMGPAARCGYVFGWDLRGYARPGLFDERLVLWGRSAAA